MEHGNKFINSDSGSIDLSTAITVLSHPGKRSIREMRTLIMGLEAAMQAMPERLGLEVFKIKHHFAPGLYLREGFIPAGTVLTGEIHKTEHYCILSQGEVSVMTEDGIKRIFAPAVIHSMPGMKRVIYAHRDSTWVNIHHNPTNERDLKKIHEILTFKTFEELEMNDCQNLMNEKRG